MTEEEARKPFWATPEAKEIWARVAAAYDTGADPWPIRDEYDAAEAAYVAAHATTPDEPTFHDKWQAMTAEEQAEWTNGNDWYPSTEFRDGVHESVAARVGYHAGLYERGTSFMTLAMWHPDGGNGRVPYHTLNDAVPDYVCELWAEIDRNHSRAMARNVKQNILNKLRKRDA